jgi:hypothetical protein
MMNGLNQPRRKSMKWMLLGLALFLIILGCAVLAGGKILSWKMKMALKGDYQAVFLTNGQVYFGKMEFEHGWIVLKDIYYLQLSEDLQPASSADTNTTTTPAGQSDQQKIQLVKLGQELHGPQDQMYIAKDKVMFWENMKDDSKVLQSIKQYQSK